MDDYDKYYPKYLKYKDKYLKLQAQQGGFPMPSMTSMKGFMTKAKQIASDAVAKLPGATSSSHDEYKLYFCNDSILKLLIQPKLKDLITEKTITDYLSIDYTQEYRCIAFEANIITNTLVIVKSPETCIEKKIYLTKRQEIDIEIGLLEQSIDYLKSIITNDEVEQKNLDTSKLKSANRKLSANDEIIYGKLNENLLKNRNTLQENEDALDDKKSKLNLLPSNEIETKANENKVYNVTEQQKNSDIEKIAISIALDNSIPYEQITATMTPIMRKTMINIYEQAKNQYADNQKKLKQKIVQSKETIKFPNFDEDKKNTLSYRLKNLSLDKHNLVLGDLRPVSSNDTDKETFISDKLKLVKALNNFVQIVYPTFNPINSMILYALNSDKKTYKVYLNYFWNLEELNYTPCAANSPYFGEPELNE